MTSTHQRTTDKIGVTHTVRIECSCKTCAKNATLVGKALPLVAWTTESNAAKADHHALVALAHHPVMGRLQRGALAG